VTDKPIIFSAPMVRALLDGRKTQTRRVLNPQPSGIARAERIAPKSWRIFPEADRCTVAFKAPPYAPGDRLYVREAWAPLDALNHIDCGTQALADRGFYRADESTTPGEISRWRPSIHMPRWASRITLTVTEVRVQRLQAIRFQDLLAEGIEATEIHARRKRQCVEEGIDCGSVCRDSFQELWNSLHGPDAWDANPWVVAVSFTVDRRNIDA